MATQQKRPSRDKAQRSKSSSLQHQHQQNSTQHSTPYGRHTRSHLQGLRIPEQFFTNFVWTRIKRTKSKVHIHPKLYEYKSLLTHYRCARLLSPGYDRNLGCIFQWNAIGSVFGGGGFMYIFCMLCMCMNMVSGVHICVKYMHVCSFGIWVRDLILFWCEESPLVGLLLYCIVLYYIGCCVQAYGTGNYWAIGW